MQGDTTVRSGPVERSAPRPGAARQGLAKEGSCKVKKILFLTVALSLIATAAMAHDVTGRMGLGFVSTDAPVGGRYWMNEKIGIDAGIGFSSDGSTANRHATARSC